MKSIAIWESLSILGGGQKVSLDILDALKSNYRCIFFVPKEGPLTEELRDRGTKYEIIPLGDYNVGTKRVLDIFKLLYYFPRVLKRAYKYCKKNKIALIYSNGARSLIWAPLIGYILSIPVIWHVHNFFLDDKSKFLLRQLGKLNIVTRIVFVSHSLKSQFSNFDKKSDVIYNGINIDEFRKDFKPSGIREKFGIPKSKKIISTISSIMPLKKQEIFIQAIPYILEKYTNVHFIIVGEVQEGREVYYNSLINLIKELEIEGNVTFTGYRNDVHSLLREIFVNIVNSLEAFALVIPEAACLEVPSIGPNIGGANEIIKNRKTGLVYKFGDEKDLAEKILTLLKDENLYYKMKDNCREYVNKFDIKGFNKRIRRIVKKSIGAT